MGYTKTLYQELQEKAQWHLDHCEIEYDNDPEEGATAWCEHMDVTSALPEPYDYDPYENTQENDLL